MIQKVEMFTIICDNCKCDYGDDAEYSCYAEEERVREDSHENRWITDGEKDYCPDCYHYDDDDNLIIKPAK
jgi:hypothetical protein